MNEVRYIATATISWFVKTGNVFARAEENLLSIDEKSVTFTRDNLKYQLMSDLPLSPFLHGDVLFMHQEKGGKLLPFTLPETLSREDVTLIEEKAELDPVQLKELIMQRTEKLKKKLLDYQDLIRFLIKLRAEKDIKNLDFIKDLQTFQDSLYGEFLKIIEQNIGDIAQSRKAIQEILPTIPAPPVQSPIIAPTPTPSVQMSSGTPSPPAASVVLPSPTPPQASILASYPNLPSLQSAQSTQAIQGLLPIPPMQSLSPASPATPTNAPVSPANPVSPNTSPLPPTSSASKTIDDKIRSLFR